MVKRILVGLAGTEYTEVAIRRAVELASIHGATLTGVTILDRASLSRSQAVPIGAGGVATQVREHRNHVTQTRIEEATSQFLEACDAAQVAHRLEHEEGDAFKLMLSYSR